MTEPIEVGQPAGQAPKRKRWGWPVVAAALLVVVLILGGTLWFVTTRSGPGAAATPTPTATPTATPTPMPTPTPTPVSVGSLALNGLSCDSARQKIVGAGLVAACQDGDPASTSDQVGTVYDVNPQGSVLPGTTITVTVYGALVDLPAPAAPFLTYTDAPSKPVTNPFWHSDYLLNIPAYTCPASAGALGGTAVTLENATFGANGPNTQILPAGTTTTLITAGLNGNTLTATYTVTCGVRVSPVSAQLAMPIVRAE